MSTTITLQNTVTWAQTILKNAPLQVNGQEPGLSFGNWILQRMTGPPFRWRSNRGNFSFGITSAGTDYTISVADLGHIEDHWLVDANGKVHELGGRVTMARSASIGRPLEIAPVYDDNQGNITFRMSKTPDQPYTAFVDYQKKPTLMLSYGSPWGSIADEYSYIYNAGFLSLAMMITNDARFPVWESYFISSLLGAQDGLDDQAINIFLRDWSSFVRSVTQMQDGAKMGMAARGK